MALKAIYVATSTAKEIEKLLTQSTTMALEVKDLQTDTVLTLHVKFLGFKKGGVLHGRTEDAHIFIKLGDVNRRHVYHPSVVHYVNQATKSGSTPKGLL